MTRNVALVCPEPLRERVQGIGIRFLEMASCLARDHRVTLWAPNEDIPPKYGNGIRPFDPNRFARDLSRQDIVIVQGHVSEMCFDLLDRVAPHARPAVVVDLYDPFLVENLHYASTLGERVFVRDRGILSRQLMRGDFFLTSSESQRLFYIGLLLGLGRLVPAVFHEDPTLRTWIEVVPFGVRPLNGEPNISQPGRLKGVIPGIGPEDVVIFFGGVYDWYDPFTLVEAATPLVADGWPLRMVFCENPNRAVTPQHRLEQLRQWASLKGWTGRYVFFIPWFAYDKRFSFYRDVDVAVCLHRPSLETDLSLRTRLLDYMNAGIPMVVSEGGEGSRLVQQAGAGLLVKPADWIGTYRALNRLISDQAFRRQCGENGRQWVHQHMSWDRTLEPLQAFCRNPVRWPMAEGLPYVSRRGLSAVWRRAVEYMRVHGVQQTFRRIVRKMKVSR